MGRQNLSNYKVFFAFYFFFCPAAWVPIRAPPFGIPLYSPALGPHLGTPLGPLFLLKFFCASQVPCFIMVLGPFSEDALPGGSPEGVLWRALGGRSPGCLELIWRASGGPSLQLRFGTPFGDPLADPYFSYPPGDRGPLLYFSCFWHLQNWIQLFSPAGLPESTPGI